MNQPNTKEPPATVPVELHEVRTRVVLKIIFIILAVLGLLSVIGKITGLILLLVLSIFFAYFVSPLVEFLRRPRTIANRPFALPKVGAIALSYLIIAAGILFVIFVVVPSLRRRLGDQRRILRCDPRRRDLTDLVHGIEGRRARDVEGVGRPVRTGGCARQRALPGAGGDAAPPCDLR